MSAASEPTSSPVPAPAPAPAAGGDAAPAPPPAAEGEAAAALAAAAEEDAAAPAPEPVPAAEQRVAPGEVRQTTDDDGLVYFWWSCPWCGATIRVASKQMACQIFRCGVFIATGRPIPPHAPQAQCEALVARGLIAGCGRPMRTIDRKTVEQCGWI